MSVASPYRLCGMSPGESFIASFVSLLHNWRRLYASPTSKFMHRIYLAFFLMDSFISFNVVSCPLLISIAQHYLHPFSLCRNIFAAVASYFKGILRSLSAKLWKNNEKKISRCSKCKETSTLLATHNSRILSSETALCEAV